MAPKLSYFPIEAAAEKIRLTFVLTGAEFEDKRIPFPEWKELKAKTKYGQMPFLTLDDGTEMYQSVAIMKFVAKTYGDDKLFPMDPKKMYEMEEMFGLFDDFGKNWTPALYMGMGRHTNFGHPEEWPDKDATTKAMREQFVAEKLPEFMGHLSRRIEEKGSAFLCGPDVTLADLLWIPQLRYFAKGVADHVPKDCLEAYPVVTAYMARFMEIPAVKEWYEAHP